MTISKIVAAELISSEGVTETAGTYHSNDRRAFQKDMELINKEGDTSVYKRAGDDIFIEDYDSNREDTNRDDCYILYDLVWKDNMIKYVSNTTGLAVKQPEEYDNTDTSFDSSDWQYRYMLFGTLGHNSSLNQDVLVKSFEEAGYVYVYSFVNVYSQWFSFTSARMEVGTTKYGCTNCSECTDNQYIDKDNLKYKWKEDEDGTCVWKERDLLLADGTTISEDDYVMDSAGNVYKVADEIETGKAYFYTLSEYADEHMSNYTTYYTELTNSSTEKKPDILKDDDGNIIDGNIWRINTAIRRGNDVYVRTHIDYPVEYKNVDAFEYTELRSIDEIPWDWVYSRPTQEYAPFDDKKYTVLEAHNDVKYTVKSKDEFDVICGVGLRCSRIVVEIYNSDNEMEEQVTVFPKCVSVLEDKTFQIDGTSVIYLKKRYPIDTRVEITFYTLDGKVKIGGGYLGDKRSVGWINLSFRNRTNDYGTYEKDKFGNVLYVANSGAKVRKLEGSCDIDITTYDDIEPILRDLLSTKVIIDGCDNLSNLPTDSYNFFLATQMVGRLRTAEQTTKVDNNRLSELATYSFVIEEDI